MYIQVPSTSSSRPASSIRTPESVPDICGTQPSHSSASINTAHKTILMTVPNPKLSPNRMATPIAAAPTMTEAVP